MEKEKKKGSILRLVTVLFLIGTMIVGLLTFVVQKNLADRNVQLSTEQAARQIADEVVVSLQEFTATEWLLRYWYEHAYTMDVEYDVNYKEGTRTEDKCRVLVARHPHTLLKYVGLRDIKSWPEEDQKLYAEITYTWFIMRINQIKQTHDIEFLFGVVAQKPYNSQFFLFSAAEEGAHRGTNYEEVYPLGTLVKVDESLQTAMREATANNSYLADAGKYVDYYTLVTRIGDRSLLLGMTYDLSALRADAAAQTLRGTLLAMLFQIVLALLILILVYFFTLKPLKTVQQNIRLYTRTKASGVVTKNLETVRPRNEIGQLSEDVSLMVTEIDDYLKKIETITVERERIGAELQLASRIQASMLPSTFPAFPDRREFDLFAMMDPAKEVGGDFYDFYMIDDDHLCMTIADVSGKGVPAALFMMASKIILANNAIMGRSPAEILRATNDMVCASNPEEMFVTVWLGILEISTGKLRAANAGHEYPVIKEPDGGYALLKDKHGFVIGGMEGMRYSEYEVQMSPGSSLFLYTDGVPEATDAAQEMFGTERMVEALNAAADPLPQSVLESVKTAVDGFVKEAEQFDDLTMLCLVYNGTGSGVRRREMTVEARTNNLEAVTEMVNAEMDRIGASEREKSQVDIVLDELFSNVAFYAYDPGTGPVTVCVETEEETPSVQLTLIDQGKPYDPLSRRDPDVTLPAQERGIGGLGIYIVKKTMDEVSYEYKKGQNILRVRKILKKDGN